MKSFAPYLIVAVLAWIVGAVTCQPRESADVRILRDSLQTTRTAFDSTVAALSASWEADRRAADSLARQAGIERQRADAARERALQERSRGDALAVAVQQARTAADSLPLLVEQVAALRDERDGWHLAADRYREALDDQMAAFARLSQGADSVVRVSQEQAARIVVLEDLVGRTRPRGPDLSQKLRWVGLGLAAGVVGWEAIR